MAKDTKQDDQGIGHEMIQAVEAAVSQEREMVAHIEKLNDIQALEVIIATERGPLVLDAAKKRWRFLMNERKRAMARSAEGTYRVTCFGFSRDIQARDESEAWAIWNGTPKKIGKMKEESATDFGPKTPGRVIVRIAA